METLQQLEWQYEKDKQVFHEELSAQYSELCRGLISKRDRLDRAKHQFSQESGVALDGNTHTRPHARPAPPTHPPACTPAAYQTEHGMLTVFSRFSHL